MYSIRIAKENDQTNWQRFFKESKERNFSFDWRWKDIIQSVFTHEPRYLLAENEDKKVVAILPFFYVKSLLFGSALISVPYLNGGGILIDKDLKSDSLEIFNLMLEKLISESQEKGVHYTEIRARTTYSSMLSNLTLKEKTHKVAMSRILTQDPESLFSSFPPKLRSQIRRPTKEGCHVVSVTGNEVTPSQVNQFFSVFSQNMRDLGTPVFPKELFSESLSAFGKKSRLTMVFHQSTPVSTGITIGNHDTVEVPWAASLKKYRKMSPNMLLYWEMMKYSILDGYLRFDFGRSSLDSGTYKFKAQWGAVPDQLHWYYHILKGEVPEISPQNQKMAALVTLWKYLPLPLTTIMGKYITRSLP